MKRMNVLIACEESQAVVTEMRKLGHRAFSCDIQPCSGDHPEWHILGNVLGFINGDCVFKTMDGKLHKQDGRWDLLIAHPPCTYLSNAGACRMYPTKGQIDPVRYEKAMKAKAFFMEFWNADCPKICVENPMPLSVLEMPAPSQYIHPYQMQYTDDEIYTHPYTKRTGLWLKGLPLLKPTSPDAKPVGPYVPSGTGRKNKASYGAAKRGDDSKNRSKTMPGLARAIAEQWAGKVTEEDER